jgi:hypothetical protein
MFSLGTATLFTVQIGDNNSIYCSDGGQQLYLLFSLETTTPFNVQMGDNNSYCKCRTGYSKLTDKLPTVCIQSNSFDKFLDFLDRNLPFFRGELVDVLDCASSLILHFSIKGNEPLFIG